MALNSSIATSQDIYYTRFIYFLFIWMLVNNARILTPNQLWARAGVQYKQPMLLLWGQFQVGCTEMWMIAYNEVENVLQS